MWRLIGCICLLSRPGHCESCWSDGYSAELCCDTELYGPSGNAACWDGSDFTYDACCCEGDVCYARKGVEARSLVPAGGVTLVVVTMPWSTREAEVPWGAWKEPLLGNPVEEPLRSTLRAPPRLGMAPG
eukprot:Skav215924  [mRNA]  locus=scaffold226:261926:264128:+ [translate_table: standard]